MNRLFTLAEKIFQVRKYIAEEGFMVYIKVGIAERWVCFSALWKTWKLRI